MLYNSGDMRIIMNQDLMPDKNEQQGHGHPNQ